MDALRNLQGRIAQYAGTHCAICRDALRNLQGRIVMRPYRFPAKSNNNRTPNPVPPKPR